MISNESHFKMSVTKIKSFVNGSNPNCLTIKNFSMKLILHRLYTPEATHGLLQLDGRNFCFVIELPWLANQRSISCIPEGTYRLQRRYSPRFKEHFEVLNVADRKAILIHPANNAQRDLKGCLAPVSQLLAPGWGSRSRIAMQKLSLVLQPALVSKEVVLTIQQATDDNIIQIIKKGQL